MRQKDMTPERFNRLLGSGIFADVCDVGACLDDRDAVRIALKLGVALFDQTVILAVNYSQSLDQMIATGHYDWVNGDITVKRFPIVGEGTVEFEARLFHFNRSMSSENAVERTRNADTTNPWEPAKIEHVLSFGAKYPEEQRKYAIIGLGSVAEVGGGRGVPDLHRTDAERNLNLRWWGDGWDGRYRFLAVRKLSSAA
ncbi:MAG: hypothetical protein Q8R39_02805 [bacterium]|nr:hypothetical protein [bacterium]MDZ4284922.1 hypothetical protein [Patescibacteria group bacterium]